MLFPVSTTYINLCGGAFSLPTRGSPGCMCAVLQCTELIARHMGKRSKLSSKVPAPFALAPLPTLQFDAPARFAKFWRVLDPREQLVKLMARSNFKTKRD
jgi:hypothetical protein